MLGTKKNITKEHKMGTTVRSLYVNKKVWIGEDKSDYVVKKYDSEGNVVVFCPSTGETVTTHVKNIRLKKPRNKIKKEIDVFVTFANYPKDKIIHIETTKSRVCRYPAKLIVEIDAKE